MFSVIHCPFGYLDSTPNSRLVRSVQAWWSFDTGCSCTCYSTALWWS